MRGLAVCAALFSALPMTASAQPLDKRELLRVVRDYRRAHEHAIIQELLDLLSIPNVSNDKANLERNAEVLRKSMEARGVRAQIFETPGNPIVYGELAAAGASQTLMFYVHYDGQPVVPSQWTDTEPFRPVLRPGRLEPGTREPRPIPLPPPGQPFDDNWRIYARSASDDKSPFISLLTAMDALKSAGIPTPNNIKFLLDGEEEAGSPSLRGFCEEKRDLLKSDVLFICDGPVYYSGDPTLWFGCRGSTSLEITVYGPNTTLHSGHFGNWAPNPVMRLAQLVATMKDSNGRVTIPGFYDTVVPLSEREREALKAVPPYDEELKELYGFPRPEGSGMTLMEAIQWPSLNLRGIEGGVGSSISSTAKATVEIRLVKAATPQYMLERVIDYVKSQGYHVVGEDPDHETRMKHPLIAKVTGGRGYGAARTSMDLPVARRVIDALSGYHDKDLVLVPSMGASISMYLFTDILDMPVIFLPTVNHDNNQHGPDENVRLGQFWTGIETFAAVMMMGDGSRER